MDGIFPALDPSQSRAIAYRCLRLRWKYWSKRQGYVTTCLVLAGGWGRWRAGTAQSLGRIHPWQSRLLRGAFTTCAARWRRRCAAWGLIAVVVSKLLNHAETGITKIYDRYGADAEKAAAMEKWAQKLREIISGRKPDKVVRLQGRG